MSWTSQQIRELKVGRYMVIDDEPCKIVDLTTSKPGKHGEAKARIVAVGMFDGAKRSVVYPVTHKVQVPMIDKRNAQVVSIQNEALSDELDQKYQDGTLTPADAASYDKVKQNNKLTVILAAAGGALTLTSAYMFTVVPSQGGAGVAVAGRF